MADRPVLRRRGTIASTPPVQEKAPAKPVRVSKPVVEEEDLDDDDDLEDADDDLEDDTDIEEEDDEPVTKKTAVLPPVKKVAPVVKKPVPAAVVEDDDDDVEPPAAAKPVRVKSVEATIAGASMLELLEGMEVGKSIIISRSADNKWLITNELPKIEKADGLRGAEYWQEVLDPAYNAWWKEWHNLSQEERIKKAKKAGVTWKEDKDPRVNIMRATEAYRTEMEIEKYKPEYKTRAARARIQGK